VRLPRPNVHVPRPHLHLRLHVPRPHLRVPSSPVPALIAFVARWRGGREKLSLERRRARTVLIGAIVFAAIVLLTSFPIGGLLSQRSAISGAAQELNTVKAENDALARQVSDLSNPAAVNDLARHDYGFVPKGQRVFDILPSSSPTGSALAGSGEVPLNGPPVVPGSTRSQALIGVVSSVGAVSPSPATSARAGADHGSSATANPPAPPEPHSYWGRVVKSLEFWN
jgi:cell division protein FtsB